MHIYTDASWHCPRSQSGGCLCIGQNIEGKFRSLALLDYSSNKQGITADSSAASELIAAQSPLKRRADFNKPDRADLEKTSK